MAKKESILIVGTGAVGTMAAYTLQNSGMAIVTAVLRSNHDLVQAEGLYIKSIDHGELHGWRPNNIVKSIPDAQKHGPFDYVVVTLKNLPDVYSIPDMIRCVVTLEKSTIVLIQNGIDIERPVKESFPHTVLLSGVAMVGAELDGRDVLHNEPDVLTLGSYGAVSAEEKLAANKSCELFAEMYNVGGAKCHISENIVLDRWRKLVWNGSFNSVCAIVNIDSGTVQDAGALRPLIRPAMDEIVATAKAAGYQLPDSIQDTMVASTPRETHLKPSMQVDAARGRPMEIEVILGNPIRIAKALDVATPTLEMLFSLLKVKQWSFLHGGSVTK